VLWFNDAVKKVSDNERCLHSRIDLIGLEHVAGLMM